MIEPLSIEAAKDKAAQEYLYQNWSYAVRNGSENDLNVITNRAMILFSKSQLQCKTAGQTESHPCKLCGEMTEPLAGDPSKWPVYLPYLSEPGKGNFFHSGCISDILRTADEAVQSKMEEIEQALQLHMDEDMQRSWEVANHLITGGVNPTAYEVGFKDGTKNATNQIITILNK